MPTLALPSSCRRSGAALPARALVRRLVDRARRGDRTLVAFGVVMAALGLLFIAASAFDERTLRGANVWVKPFKFALAIALLSWTTALFAGVVDAGHRARSRSLRWLRRTLIAAGSFEIAYIGIQAALGQASHFNESTPFHAVMYPLMGVGAIALSATQPWLAWHVGRHAEAGLAPALRLAIVFGLVLTFALGATVGGLMSGMPAPSNAGGLPIVGWSFGSGDLRPAHFVGIHAGQAIPLVGAWLVAQRVDDRRARRVVAAFAALWTLVFAVALAAAFAPAVATLAA